MTQPNGQAGVDFIGTAVSVLIFNDKGEVFLAKRAPSNPNPSNEPGAWETPNGEVGFGEMFEDAAVRVVAQQFGATVELLRQFVTQELFTPSVRHHWTVTTYLARFHPAFEPSIQNPAQFDAFGWFALDKLPTPLTRLAVQEIKRIAPT